MCINRYNLQDKNHYPVRKPTCGKNVLQSLQLHSPPFQHLIRFLNIAGYLTVLFLAAIAATICFQDRLWSQSQRTWFAPLGVEHHCHVLDCSSYFIPEKCPS